TSLETPLVLGNYAYADGAMFVRVAAAADALTAALTSDVPARALAYLAGPTDVFAVPMPVVEAARDGGGIKRRGRLISGPMRALFPCTTLFRSSASPSAPERLRACERAIKWTMTSVSL